MSENVISESTELCGASVRIGCPHRNTDPVPWSDSCLHHATAIAIFDPLAFVRVPVVES